MISFTPTHEQQLIIETVRRYANERVRLAAHAAEELGYGDLAMALYLLTPNLFGIPLLHCGSEDQKQKWLPRLTDADFVPATAALIEPHWDFNPHALSTTAERVQNGYVLNGHKAYVPLAADAQAMLVYARESGASQAFIVEQGTSGVTVREREKNMGVRALPTYEVKFEDVRVSRDARLGGEVGSQIDLLLNYSRVTLAALAVGVARGAFEYARDYAKQRETFGRPIAQYQAVAFMLAEMAIEIDAARLMAWEAAWTLDQGKDATRQAALAKQYADEAVLFVTDRAVQVLGGHGYIREHPVERWLRNGRGFTTFLGLAMI